MLLLALLLAGAAPMPGTDHEWRYRPPTVEVDWIEVSEYGCDGFKTQQFIAWDWDEDGRLIDRGWIPRDEAKLSKGPGDIWYLTVGHRVVQTRRVVWSETLTDPERENRRSVDALPWLRCIPMDIAWAE